MNKDVFFAPGPPESLEIEKKSRDEILTVQSRKLVALLKHSYENIPYYKNLWDKAGVDLSCIKGVEDLERMPFTTKKDQSEEQINNPPFGKFTADLASGEKGLVTLFSTSGTTGKSRYYPFTLSEWKSLLNLYYRHTFSIGLNKNDVGQVLLTYGMGLGNMVVDSLMEKTGCLTIPADVFQFKTKAQIEIMKNFGTTYFFATPSYALYMAEYALNDLGIDVAKDLKVRAITVGGEPGPSAVPETRARIESLWGAKVYDWYGSMELGAGIGECAMQSGFHVPEDSMIVEVVDPVTNKPLPEGKVGELVFTNLHKPNCPSIRWKSGDMGIIKDDPCPCGRQTRRVVGVLTRADDMIIIKGKNIFPSAVESIVRGTPELGMEYKIVVNQDDRGLDNIKVVVESKDSTMDMDSVSRNLQEKFRNSFGIRFDVEIVPPMKLERTKLKARRVEDLRKR